MTLDDLEKTLAAMTPGPWRTGTSDDHWRREVRSGDGSVAFCSHVQQEAHADAAGIATLRNIAAELIAVARAAKDVSVLHGRACVRELCPVCEASRSLDAALSRLAPPKAGD